MSQGRTGHFDRPLLVRFARQVRGLADEIAIREPTLAEAYGSRLPFMVALMVATEVQQARGEGDRIVELVDAFATLEGLAATEVLQARGDFATLEGLE